MTFFNAILWFESLTHDGRVKALRHLLNAFGERDPGFANSQSSWHRGDSVSIGALLPFDNVMRPVSVHLLVEGGDADLLSILEGRLVRGGVQPRKATTSLADGSFREAWIADVGTRIITLFDHEGELMITATRRQQPYGSGQLRIGARFPGPLPPREGMIIKLLQGRLYLIASFKHVSERESQAVATSPIKIGLLRVTPTLLLVALAIPGLIDGWADLPFAFGMEEPQNRWIVPSHDDTTLTLTLVLVDRSTTNVAAVRNLRMSDRWSRAFLDALTEQRNMSKGYNSEQYSADIEIGKRLWPNLADTPPDLLAEIAT